MISAGDGFSRDRAYPALASSFGLKRERRIASWLSGTTPYPRPKSPTPEQRERVPEIFAALGEEYGANALHLLHNKEDTNMPKNPVSDPITDQEMAFAHLILSGTMNDRRAAEAVGLNPETAGYTKSKPRVRAYMIEHRAAVREKLVDQEADGLRNLNLGRDQILARLWELANLAPDATRGSIAGQVKALSMIVAIEGLIPEGRVAPAKPQPAVPAVPAGMWVPDWRRQQQKQGNEPCEPGTAVEAQPGTPAAKPHVPDQEPLPTPANKAPYANQDADPGPALNPFIRPERQNWVPAAVGCTFDALLQSAGPLSLSLHPRSGPSGRRR